MGEVFAYINPHDLNERANSQSAAVEGASYVA